MESTLVIPGVGCEAVPNYGTRHYVYIGAVLLMSLQFQTLPIGKVQMMPPSAVIALAALPFVLHRIPRSPLLSAVAVFVGFAALHSSIGLLIDMVDRGVAMRFVAWFRQFLALVGGLATFLVMRKSFMHMSDRQIVRFTIWGTIPALVLGFLNVLWGALGMGWAGSIVEKVHYALAPLGYTGSMRATGFASEPSTFAAVLVIVVVPTLLIVYGWKEFNLRYVILLGLVLISLIWTFSSVGIILLLALLFFCVMLGPAKKMMLRVGIGFALILGLALTLFPNNQIYRHAGSLAAGTANVSMTDRLYGTIGPFMTSMSSLSMIGYGLGGTSLHFSEMVPAKQRAEIMAVRWKELPSLSTLVGRIFGEIGTIGLLMFLFFIYVTLREVRVLIRKRGSPRAVATLMASRIGFIVTLVSLSNAFGSFHMPYLWLWMAVIDSRYVLMTKENDMVTK